ncbi:Hypothetical protein I5071_50170 [Sandaracinus amylolyticus]|nr:Hypothetical protein I5071_50170 [Sandaracinus amylolyticus]
MFVVLSLQVSGLLELVATSECACEDERDAPGEHECPPHCGDTDQCSGCYRPLAVMTTPLLGDAAPMSERDTTFDVVLERRPSEPDPRGLLRIPRA